MLLLTFQLGQDWYAVDTSEVIEVLPRVASKQIPQAPPAVAGVFNYHGQPVPLIDLAALSLGRPSAPQMSTRIILVRYGANRLLGVLAEKSTATIRRERADFVDAGVAVDRAPYLGPVTEDPRGLIQLIEINDLLRDDVRDLLFPESVAV